MTQMIRLMCAAALTTGAVLAPAMASANALPQPYVASISPTSGPAGTVVTISGTGLSQIDVAWVGNGHDAIVKSTSGTSLQVVVPHDASTGQIAVGNGQHWGFSAPKFVVTSTSSTQTNTSHLRVAPTRGPILPFQIRETANSSGTSSSSSSGNTSSSGSKSSTSSSSGSSSSGTTTSSTGSSGSSSGGNSSGGYTTSSGSSSSGSSSGSTTSSSGAMATPMTLLSRSVPAIATSGSGAAANDSSYNTVWRSSGEPAALAFDLSSVNAAQRQKLLLAWYNDGTYGYDHGIYGWVGYNNPGAYTVEVNSGAGGGAPPSNGWVVLLTVTSNTLHSREHVINFAGYNWVRLNFSAADGSTGNSDIAVNVDIYDASNGVTDGWLFAGDSITANTMDHNNAATVSADSFGNQVAAITGATPVQENAGMPFWTTANMKAYLPQWLKLFPGRFVTLNLGTNDAATAGGAAQFSANMSVLIEDVLAAGKIPVLPTVPWSRDANHAANIPSINQQIKALYAAYPQVVPGPDLYAFTYANQAYISSDNLHPTNAGVAAIRTLWAQTAAQIAYK